MQIDYFLTPVSPYVYLGHPRLVAMARQHHARIRIVPIDLGGQVFPVSGGLPLGKRPVQRQAYRLIELVRWSHFLGLPLNPQPKHFPVSDNLASRCIIASTHLNSNEEALRFAGAIMNAVWARDMNVADPEVLVQLARESDLNGERLLTEAENCQSELDSNTQEAIVRQVFGAPWYFLGEEPFWGQDRLDFLERAMQAKAGK